MYTDKILNLKLKLLQNKTQRFNNKNINNLKSYSELIFALKKKYTIFFNIIEQQGIQYKQFLSAFLCILNGYNEPFSIRLDNPSFNKRESKYLYKVYNIFTSNYNYIKLLPWNKYNIVKCHNINKEFRNKIRINKEQFIQCVIVLFPKFIKKYPKLFFELIQKLQDINKETISVIHLYKYLVYCGDKLAKDEYYNKSLKDKNKFKFNKKKIEIFLRIFTYEQLINILL